MLRRLLEWVEARDPLLVLREEEEERKVLNLIVAEEVEEEDEEEEKEDFITIDLSPPPRSFPKMMTLSVLERNEATIIQFRCSVVHIYFLDWVAGG
tara:strand:- start:2270 stop:2557 length:288 start_codon:yes stop_codon:yes gene_type:complete